MIGTMMSAHEDRGVEEVKASAAALEQMNRLGWEAGLGTKLWTRRSCRLWAHLKKGRGRLGKICEEEGLDQSHQKVWRMVY